LTVFARIHLPIRHPPVGMDFGIPANAPNKRPLRYAPGACFIAAGNTFTTESFNLCDIILQRKGL
jgi:hypothetical protein